MTNLTALHTLRRILRMGFIASHLLLPMKPQEAGPINLAQSHVRLCLGQCHGASSCWAIQPATSLPLPWLPTLRHPPGLPILPGSSRGEHPGHGGPTPTDRILPPCSITSRILPPK